MGDPFREFVKSGINQGTRPEFQGGGLVRSAGGSQAGLIGRNKEERERADARILGDGVFVNEVLYQADACFERKFLPKPAIEELVEIVASHLDLKPEGILCAGRRKPICEARALVCHFAINDLNYSASEVARSLAISRVNAARCAQCGKSVLCRYEDLKDIVQ